MYVHSKYFTLANGFEASQDISRPHFVYFGEVSSKGLFTIGSFATQGGGFLLSGIGLATVVANKRAFLLNYSDSQNR